MKSQMSVENPLMANPLKINEEYGEAMLELRLGKILVEVER